MALRVLVFAALRVLAVYLVVRVLDLVPFILTMLGGSLDRPAMALSTIAVFAVMIIVAVFLWVIAGRLAPRIVRECDPILQFQLTLEDAYAICFVFLGLDVILSSLGSAVIDIFGLVSLVSRHPTDDLMSSGALLNLCAVGITLGAGLTALIGHRTWARKLARLDTTKVE